MSLWAIDDFQKAIQKQLRLHFCIGSMHRFVEFLVWFSWQEKSILLAKTDFSSTLKIEKDSCNRRATYWAEAGTHPLRWCCASGETKKVSFTMNYFITAEVYCQQPRHLQANKEDWKDIIEWFCRLPTPFLLLLLTSQERLFWNSTLLHQTSMFFALYPNNLRGISFNNDVAFQNWLNEYFTF